MQLKVTVPSDDESALGLPRRFTVGSFRDIVAIGATVARGVREWLRQVPMTPHPQSRNFYITAEWVEDKKPAAGALAEKGGVQKAEKSRKAQRRQKQR